MLTIPSLLSSNMANDKPTLCAFSRIVARSLNGQGTISKVFHLNHVPGWHEILMITLWIVFSYLWVWFNGHLLDACSSPLAGQSPTSSLLHPCCGRRGSSRKPDRHGFWDTCHRAVNWSKHRTTEAGVILHSAQFAGEAEAAERKRLQGGPHSVLGGGGGEAEGAEANCGGIREGFPESLHWSFYLLVLKLLFKEITQAVLIYFRKKN